MFRALLLIVFAILALALNACNNTSTSPEDKSAPAVSASPVISPKTGERPSFAARIDNVSVYPVPNNKDDLAITLVVSVNNFGAPSTVQGWNLEVGSPSRSIPTFLEPVHINGVVDLPGGAARAVDLGKEDLVVKTSQAQIGKGAAISGVLTFVLPRAGEGDVANSTSFVLRFKDAQGNSYQTPKGLLGGKVTPR